MAGLQWNDPDERKTTTIPAVSNPIYIPPSPRQYGAARPEEVSKIPGRIATELTRPPSTPFEQDLAAGEEAIRGVARTAATGVSNLAGSAERMIFKGVRGLSGGISNYFTGEGSGLLTQNTASPSTPAVTPPPPAMTTPLPAAAKPFAPPPVAAGIPGKTKEQFMEDIAATRVPSASVSEGRGISGRVTMGGTTIEVPRSALEYGVEKPARNYEAELDAVINKLMEPQYNRQGKRLTNTQEFRMASALKQTQVAGKYGVEGHKITAEASRAGHELAAKERVGLERDKLAETTRYHDILKMNAKDKADQDKFLREEALSLRKAQGEEAAIKTFGQYTNTMGETAYHPAIAVFKMIDSGYDTSTLSPQYRSIADRLKAQFKEYAIAQKKANSKLTPAQIKGAFYEELRGVK